MKIGNKTKVEVLLAEMVKEISERIDNIDWDSSGAESKDDDLHQAWDIIEEADNLMKSLDPI